MLLLLLHRLIKLLYKEKLALSFFKVIHQEVDRLKNHIGKIASSTFLIERKV
jgi:hypothetical protein